MYFRDENGKIIEGYDGGSDVSNCTKTPLWVLILLIFLVVLFIIFLVYHYIKNKNY